MKAALLTNFIPPYRKSLFEALHKNVGELKVFVSTSMEKNRAWKTDYGSLEVVEQKSWSYLKSWKTKHGYTEQSEVHLVYDTIGQLKAYSPDVVISGELGMRSLLAAAYCKLFRKPLILWLTLSMRTESHKSGLRLWLRKYVLRAADAIFCNGNSCNDYVASLGIKKQTYFVPYTSDYELMDLEFKTPNAPRRLICSGQLIKRKGISEMVNALAIWAKANPAKNIELLIAGDGPEKEKFHALDAFANIQYSLLGNMAYAELAEQYRSADFCLFPTLADEWGVVVNEALASGTPVIGSLYSQAVEMLIEPGKNGWTFQPDKADDFSSVISKALTCSDETLHQMSVYAQKSVEKYSAENVALTMSEAAASLV